MPSRWAWCWCLLALAGSYRGQTLLGLPIFATLVVLVFAVQWLAYIPAYLVSRHPNYFGEITLWVGVFLTAAPALVGWQWVALLSPLVVTLLLTKVSGIPMLEKKAEKKWGDDPKYRAYVENTPVLIPFTKGG